MRLLAPAAVIAAALSLAPAHADGPLTATTVTCVMSYATGTATCTVTGLVNSAPVVLGPAAMTFTATLGCPTATGHGFLTGAVVENVAWTRVGPAAVTLYTGTANGAGAVAFTTPCPADGELAVFAFASLIRPT